MSENGSLASLRNGNNYVLPPINDILSSQISTKSYEKEPSSQDTSVNGISDIVDSDRSTSSRQKIELAINELNLDEASIKDLKNAFSLEDGGSDVASALLRLGQANKKDLRTQLKYGMQVPNSLPYYHGPPPKFTKTIRNNYQRMTVSPYHFPKQLHNPGSVPQMNNLNRPAVIRRTKEFTSIKIKLRQTQEYWEVLANTLEFEPHQVNMQLVKYPSNQSSMTNRTQVADRDALLIEAAKLVTIHSADGSVLEKTISARSLIPLGGFAKSGALGICQVGNGITRIRILKNHI